MTSRLPWWLPGIVVLLSCGCGPGRGDLTGKVLFQEKPLRFGAVTVLPSDGIVRSAVIGSGGEYQIANIPAGDIKLAVTSPDPAEAHAHPRKKGEAPPKVDRSGWFPIPTTYADFATSGLNYSLKSGANSWDIRLK